MSKKTKPQAGANRQEVQSELTTDDSRIEFLPLSSIKPSPENDDIYGRTAHDAELSELAKDIRQNGIREPITISEEGYIVSGHRRYAAAKIARLTLVPVRRIDLVYCDYSPIAWKRILIAHNRQRVKSAAMRVRESLLTINPELAHRQLMESRDAMQRDQVATIVLRDEIARSPISPAKLPMLNAAVRAIENLRSYCPLTVRQVHYRLLNEPPLRHANKPSSTYGNNRQSYSDLCDLLARARLSGQVPWQAISDSTRPISGLAYALDAGQFIARESTRYLAGYRRDLMQSQHDHVEIIAEKLTVQRILRTVADRYCVPLTIGRGYCSLGPRHELAQRFRASGKNLLTLIVASDLDPDGDNIAESFGRSMRDDFGIEPRCVKALLTMDQVQEWSLPPNGMAAKQTSSSYAAYRSRYGTDNVFELEAAEPSKMQQALAAAIESVIDVAVYHRELDHEQADAATLSAVKLSVTEYLADLEIGRQRV